MQCLKLDASLGEVESVTVHVQSSNPAEKANPVMVLEGKREKGEQYLFSKEDGEVKGIIKGPRSMPQIVGT